MCLSELFDGEDAGRGFIVDGVVTNFQLLHFSAVFQIPVMSLEATF